jgi:hypothetical protein
MEDYRSLGVKSFGNNVVVSYIKAMNSIEPIELPVVSVGSGLAQIEHEAQKSCPTLKWICVDPNPTSYHDNELACPIFIQPSYDVVETLIKQQPKVVDNCKLFLNWCLPNFSTYDYEAIILLKPSVVLCIYEEFEGNWGAAGGMKFFKWINDKNKPYREISKCTLTKNPIHTSDTLYDIRMVLLVRNDIPQSDLDLPKTTTNLTYHKPSCLIM